MMNKDDLRTFLILIVTLLLLIAMSFLTGFISGKKSTLKHITSNTDTVIVRETIHDTVPVPKYIKLVKHVTDTFKVVEVIHDTVDKAVVEVPITQKTYATKDYKATIEGYRARLVDMTTYPETRYITTTNTVVKHRHWTIMVGSQLGYGFTTKGTGLYSGGGVSAGYAF
jgi:hypothetical protein